MDTTKPNVQSAVSNQSAITSWQGMAQLAQTQLEKAEPVKKKGIGRLTALH